MTNTKIDYDALLEGWAEELFQKADAARHKKDLSKVGSYEYGYYKGLNEGYIEAIARLNFLESRNRNKYKS